MFIFLLPFPCPIYNPVFVDYVIFFSTLSFTTFIPPLFSLLDLNNFLTKLKDEEISIFHHFSPYLEDFLTTFAI